MTAENSDTTADELLELRRFREDVAFELSVASDKTLSDPGALLRRLQRRLCAAADALEARADISASLWAELPPLEGEPRVRTLLGAVKALRARKDALEAAAAKAAAPARATQGGEHAKRLDLVSSKIEELRGIAKHLVLALPTEAERDAMRACIDYCAGGLKRSSTPQVAGNYLYRVDAILSMLSRVEDTTKGP